MKMALKEGGCLTWITILNNFELVKSEKKEGGSKMK